ncbi:MAG: sugar phosphate isomerase/epimerase [Ruminococcaceae bacterium]|nr:sugar phosphate isomerase/epimerase [Oscillospiraceae bacterium]
MRLSINENYITYHPQERRKHADTLKLIKECGFDTIDFGLFQLDRHYDEGDDHDAWIHGKRAYCDKLGLQINQTHAPFYEGCPMPEGYRERLLQCVRDTAALGAECMVVHADTWYEKSYNQWNYEAVLAAVYEVYAPAVELATRLGVKIAMETLHEWLGNVYHRVRLCAFVEELNDIVGKFNCDTVGVCWDFGHAGIVYKEDQFEAMKRLKYPIIATHIHDNTFKRDNHNLPFQGSVDWYRAMQALAAQGYTGDLTLELNHGALPDELAPDFIRYAHKTVSHLADIFVSCKNAVSR